MGLLKCFQNYELSWDIFWGIFIFPIIEHVFREFLHYTQFERMQSIVKNTKKYKILARRNFHFWIRSLNLYKWKNRKSSKIKLYDSVLTGHRTNEKEGSVRYASLRYFTAGGVILVQWWNYGRIIYNSKEINKINNWIVSLLFTSLIAVFSYVFFLRKLNMIHIFLTSF